MRLLPRFLAGTFAAAALVAAPATAAHADVGHNSVHSYGHKIGSHAVFAQTNDPAGNAVLVFDRASDGTLSPAGSYATGGKGDAQSGAVVDPLASQGSVVYDAASHVLLVTNAGSNSVSVFRVDGDVLDLRQVVPSGGAFPTSIAVHGISYTSSTPVTRGPCRDIALTVPVCTPSMDRPADSASQTRTRRPSSRRRARLDSRPTERI